jgi:Spy/CpxP family protein refolding chaperone
MRMPWKSVLLILAIGWCLGAACGAIIAHCVCSPTGAHWRHTGRERFYKELALSPQQRTQVDEILKKKHERLDQVFAESNLRIENARIATRDDIRAVLTPEQQAKFDKLDAVFAQRFKKRFEYNTDKR